MMRELRKDLRDGLSGALTRGNRGEFDVRMMEEQPHQFLPGVTGGADDGDFFFHVGCPRSVVRGPWSVVRGPWSVVRGPWSFVGGRRLVHCFGRNAGLSQPATDH